MTEEEVKESLEILKRAALLADLHGAQILAECDKNAAVSTMAAAIMLSTFTSAAGMTMHDAVDLFMSVHKRTEAMVKGRR